MFITNVFKRLNFSNQVRLYSKIRHPYNRTVDLLKDEITSYWTGEKQIIKPEHADVVVIGGGVLGSSIAYWLKTRAGEGLSVVVLEKDFKFTNGQHQCFTGVSQHFSLRENILLSQYSAEFFRNIKDHLGTDVDLKYSPHGNLVLANDTYAELLEHNATIQMECGVRNKLLTPEKINLRFPWLNVDNVKLGCIGSESEGWFDSWSLHKGFICKAKELGATYVEAEATGFDFLLQQDFLMEGIKPGSFRKLGNLQYTTPDGENCSIKFALCVLAGGSNSGEIAKFADIGTGDGMLSIPLPVKSRSNRVYHIEASKDSHIGLDTPLVKDINGTWIRRNGFSNSFICGHMPLVHSETSNDHLSNDEYFESVVQPLLIQRIPALSNAKMIHSATEVCDCNTFDESGFIGTHPYHVNLLLANGFGYLGVEHSPGIGRAIAELIIDSRYMTIDLTRYGFDRIFTDQPVIEVNSY